jgi:hypothetical protein
MKNYIEGSMSFAEYSGLIDDLVAHGKTTGPNQSETRVKITHLNRQRMRRLEKTVAVENGLRTILRDSKRPMIWLVITEAWCGDAAQNLPVIEKIARESDNIETRYLLRDENLDLMDRFLTDGARSIPKLIAIDADTSEVLGTWGSRPEKGQALFVELRSKGVEKPLIMEQLQRWYNEDRGRSLMDEFGRLIVEWNGPMARSAAR